MGSYAPLACPCISSHSILAVVSFRRIAACLTTWQALVADLAAAPATASAITRPVVLPRTLLQ